MEPVEPNTDIIEENPVAATKGKRRTWLSAAIMGLALLALGLFALFTAVSRTKPQTPQPRLTADDLEQQKTMPASRKTSSSKLPNCATTASWSAKTRTRRYSSTT